MYTIERGPQILISLLKAHNIRKVIASPGTTNMAFVASIQKDDFFQIYSSVDERSAAYMACGMAAESGEPVVISCTGATASRNYMPGLTEAFYRKLPVVAVTSTTVLDSNGNLTPQKIDRSVSPNDVCIYKTNIRNVRGRQDEWAANTNINTALLALRHRGGGPVHINLETDYSNRYEIASLPEERVINRIMPSGVFPDLASGCKVAVFVGAHPQMPKELIDSIDEFCGTHDAIVICDLSSGYNGRFRVNSSLICAQRGRNTLIDFDVLIHIGEVSGDYYSAAISARQVWRVSTDGQVRDLWHTLRYVFEMPELYFFNKYAGESRCESQLAECSREEQEILDSIPELPYSHIWVAQQSSRLFPQDCIAHFGILNSLRSWNFFNIPSSVQTNCNVGGFGIDGIMSTLIGTSLASPEKICFAVLGDLAFFYDLNSIANRHVKSNVRILLVNNGRGAEFSNYSHPGYMLGEDAVSFVAAAGHFGNKSHKLIRHFAEDLGFEYMKADDKEEYLAVADRFFTPEHTLRPMLLEVFTDSKDESDALEIMLNLKPAKKSGKGILKEVIRLAVGEKGRKIINILRDRK